jgi:hypothetical protein
MHLIRIPIASISIHEDMRSGNFATHAYTIMVVERRFRGFSFPVSIYTLDLCVVQILPRLFVVKVVISKLTFRTRSGVERRPRAELDTVVIAPWHWRKNWCGGVFCP